MEESVGFVVRRQIQRNAIVVKQPLAIIPKEWSIMGSVVVVVIVVVVVVEGVFVFKVRRNRRIGYQRGIAVVVWWFCRFLELFSSFFSFLTLATGRYVVA